MSERAGHHVIITQPQCFLEDSGDGVATEFEASGIRGHVAAEDALIMHSGQV
jgi:hypothetical protein